MRAQNRIETLRLSSKLTVAVLYEDRYLLAIDKPAGYLVAPAHWEQTSRNLILMLREGVERNVPWARRRNLRFIANVHRLDADTSGVLLLAKNRPALIQMTSRFEQRKVKKIYYAIVEGLPKDDQFSIDLPIGQHPDITGLMAIDKKSGRPAITNFTVIERFHRHALLQVEPISGRTHQIRVHLAALGLPVISDPLYGIHSINTKVAPDKFAQVVKPPIERLALHAAQLDFKHPLLPIAVHITAPLPKDFQLALSALRRKPAKVDS